MAKANVRSWLGDAAQVALREMNAFDDPQLQLQAQAAWSAEQQAVSDQLFGAGFLLPGGETEVMRLVRPFHFSGEARLLVVGAGVAGPSQVLATQLGVLAKGYERLIDRVPPLTDANSRRPAVVPWFPLANDLPRHEFHHALLLNPLCGGPPEPVLANIVDALRPGAQLLLVEYIATPTFDPDDETTRAWMARESRTLPPDRADDLSRVLARLGLQIRSVEDLSALHMRLAVFDWRRMVSGIAARPTATRGQVMMDEAETWALRAKLMEQGQIQLMRWHAVLSTLPN